MKYEIRSKSFGATFAMRDHIHRRFGFALNRFRDRIRGLTVRVEDVNGPKGGNDKKINVLLRFKRGKTLSLKDRGADFYSLVDCAAGRLSRSVAKTLERKKLMQRGSKGWAA